VKQNRSALSSAAAQSRLRRLTLLAWAALLIERLVRGLLPAVIVAGLFVAVSWTGLWLGASGLARLSGAVVFIGLLLAALAPLRHLSIPGVADARAALDAQSAEAPAAALADALANKGDPQTLGLWRLHLRRAEKNAAGLRPVRPAPKLWIMDRYALGALVVLALAATAFMAGPEKYARFAAAFDWRLNAAENAPTRIDAWIDPPGYTGKPPIVLPLAPSDATAPITAPIGSTIIVRALDNAGVRIAIQGGIKTAAPAPGATPNQRRFLLQGDGSLRISQGAKEVGAFSLLSLPDAPPTITPLAPPQPNLRGSFTLTYRIDDDYGARDAQVSAQLSAGEAPEGHHALVEPPKGALELAPAPGGLGEARSTLDWSDSPYAGARADLILQVRDEGGNEGQAVIKGFVLPEKKLANPLARALAEQRRLLALDSGRRDKVLTAIDALMIAPELFTPKASVFLGLRFAHASLRHARTDADLVAVTDLLWEMALHIEEGDAPQAERDLRAAQKALREALSRGASPEEIERLTQQLQKALDAFLAELEKNSAQKARSGESKTGDGRTVTPKDLKSMLDQLSEAAKNGDKEAAMELLERMQDMLENLRSAEKSGESGQAARNRKAMRDIDKLMRDQQKLRDDTFTHQRSEQSESDTPPPQGGKKQQGAGQQGAPPARPKPQGGQAGAEQDDPSGNQSDASQPRQLDRRQKQLRDQLESLQKRAGPPGGEAPKGLGEADDAMKQAEQALRKGDDDGAMEAQGRALEGLRKGAGEMSAQARQGSPGDNEGEGQPDEKDGGMRGQNGEGPFGQASRRNNVDATAAQKARKVLEELRRRLSDPNRERDELDYLERLIKPD